MRHNPDPITDEEINAACALIETGWSFHRAAKRGNYYNPLIHVENCGSKRI